MWLAALLLGTGVQAPPGKIAIHAGLIPESAVVPGRPSLSR